MVFQVSGHHRPRARPRGCALFARGAAVLCCVAWLSLGGGRAAAGPDMAGLQRTGEWNRLAVLWHTMIDHSSNKTFSRERFESLAKDMDVADADISALEKQGLLPRDVAADLRRLFHARYEYIDKYHYITSSNVFMTSSESAASTSHWLTEHNLYVIRATAATPGADPRLVEAAESSTAYELAFQHHLDKFEAEVQQRREALNRQEREGKRVDWQAFDNDCERRRNLLFDAYRDRRIPIPRSVRALMPYVLALTRARPDWSSEAGVSISPGQ